jgi:hypothetical protein
MQKVTKEQFFKSVNENHLKDPMPQTSEIRWKKENGVVIECEHFWRFQNRSIFGKTISFLGGGKPKEKYQYFLAL